MTIEQRAQDWNARQEDRPELNDYQQSLLDTGREEGYIQGAIDQQELNRVELEKVKAQLASLLEVAEKMRNIGEIAREATSYKLLWINLDKAIAEFETWKINNKL